MGPWQGCRTRWQQLSAAPLGLPSTTRDRASACPCGLAGAAVAARLERGDGPAKADRRESSSSITSSSSCQQSFSVSEKVVSFSGGLHNYNIQSWLWPGYYYPTKPGRRIRSRQSTTLGKHCYALLRLPRFTNCLSVAASVSRWVGRNGGRGEQPEVLTGHGGLLVNSAHCASSLN